MNSTKTIKNSVISVTAQMLTLFLQFINRRVFVMFLDIEYLGYQSVFGNVFSVLSFAELGVGGVISFHLYREIVRDNKQEIGKLMYLYKWVYRIIAVAVTLLGLVVCIFVPYIVKDANRDVHYLYIVYFMQLTSTVAGYFLSYRRTIYIADQKEYKTVEIDLFTQIAVQAVQLSLLAVFKDYLLYLGIQLSTSFIANLVVLHRTNEEYPYLKRKYTITKDDIRGWNIVSDVKNFLLHKIAYVIDGSTNNLVISAACGIRNVALYGNYVLLQKGVMNLFFYRLLNPVQAAIGNIVYSDRKKEELWKQFEMFDVFSFFFASYISAGYLVFFQPIIQIWLGDQEYLLPYSFVVVYALHIYIGAVWEIVYKYRSVFGDYRQDRNCMLLSAFLHILLSIALSRRFGVTGIQIGSLIGSLVITYGRVRFVVRNFFGQSLKKYFTKHLFLFVVMLAESVMLYLLTYNLPVSLVGLGLRFAIWLIVPIAINLLVYFRNPHFKDMCGYFRFLGRLVVEKGLKRMKREGN